MGTEPGARRRIAPPSEPRTMQNRAAPGCGRLAAAVEREAEKVAERAAPVPVVPTDTVASGA